MPAKKKCTKCKQVHGKFKNGKTRKTCPKNGKGIVGDLSYKAFQYLMNRNKQPKPKPKKFIWGEDDDGTSVGHIPAPRRRKPKPRKPKHRNIYV